MAFFQQIEGDAAVIVENGVYKQVDLYTRDGVLYAKTGGGFVRLYVDGSTTKARCRLDFLSYDGVLHRDSLGRLCTEQSRFASPLERERAVKLLGGPVDG